MIQIKLGFNKIDNANAVTKGGQYAEGVVDNVYFTDQEINDKGADVFTASDDLKKALQQPKSSTRSSGIVVARIDWETEVRALTKLQQKVINDAEVSDEVKVEMIKSANREVAKQGANHKYKFTGKRGKNSGEVEFTAVNDEAVAHLFTWTDDLENFTNKADPWTSTGAKTTAEGVPVEKRLALFHKGIYAKKRMDWEGPIFLTVV